MAVEHRVLVTPKLYPEGEDDGTLPRTFRLEIHTEYQRRDGRQPAWMNEQDAQRETAAERLTRQQVVNLIEDAAAWLAYDGTDG
jgi:hypothetical protein